MRERVWNEKRGADALHSPRRDQNRGIGRQRAGERCGGENAKALHEHPSGAETIAQRAGCQDKRRKGDGISADDPLQFRHAASQSRGDAVQGRIDDGDIELNNAEAEAHRREG